MWDKVAAGLEFLTDEKLKKNLAKAAQELAAREEFVNTWKDRAEDTRRRSEELDHQEKKLADKIAKQKSFQVEANAKLNKEKARLQAVNDRLNRRESSLNDKENELKKLEVKLERDQKNLEARELHVASAENDMQRRLDHLRTAVGELPPQ